RRAAGFEGAAAEEFRARVFDDLRGGENLLAAFDRAGTGHDDHLLAADADAVREADDGACGPKTASGQLVGRADADDFRHAGENLEFLMVESAGSADAGEDGLD